VILITFIIGLIVESTLVGFLVDAGAAADQSLTVNSMIRGTMLKNNITN
jgi:hypothetical protein